MTPEDREPDPTPPDAGSNLSRRGLLRGAAGLGIAGAAAGLLVNATAAPALAAPPPKVKPKPKPKPGPHPGPPPPPLVAFVPDPHSGVVVLYSGERQVTVHDPGLAAALARAFATGH